MKPHLIITAATLALFHIAPVEAGIVYDVTDLGTLGGDASWANAINASGQIVGTAKTADGYYHAVLFSGTGAGNIDLGTIGGNYSYANAINASGQIVGYAYTADVDEYGDHIEHAVLFSGTGSGNIDLGTLGGNYSYASAINDNGQIVGDSRIAGDSDSAPDHATLFSGTGTGNTDLGALGGTNSAAFAINNSGQIVGYASLDGDDPVHAVIFHPADGTLTDLGTLGGSESYALAINASGQIVGDSLVTGDGVKHATLFSGTGAGNIDLGTLGGGSYVSAINASGQVVGSSEANTADGLVDNPFLYTPATGMVDLNSLLATSGWVIDYVTDINDAGQIVGEGFHNGATHAVLLTPRNSTQPTTATTSTTPAPPAPPAVTGKPKVAGNKATITGTLSTPGAYVEYAVGKSTGKYTKAKGGAKWKITAKLKPGKNIFYIRSFDPATGKFSAPKKIVVRNK